MKLLHTTVNTAGFQLLHTYAIPVATRENIIKVNDQAKKAANQQLQEFIRTIEQEAISKRIRGRVKMGTFATSLTLKADLEDCPIVTVAVDYPMTGFPWESRDDLRFLLNDYHCPLLFLHPTPEFRPPKKMLLMARNNTRISKQIFDLLTNFTLQFGSELIILREPASGPDIEVISDNEIKASLNGLTNVTTLRTGQSGTELRNLLQEYQPDLVAFSDRKQALSVLTAPHPALDWLRQNPVDFAFL